MGSSRIVVIGVTAALVFAGCGQSADEGAGSPLQPPTPVRVSGEAAAATAEASAESRLGSDAAMSSMPAFAGYTFEASPGLPSLPANSTGYQYPPDASVDAPRVAELAAALGVEGDPVPGGGPEVDGLSWRVGPDDGTAPVLTVGADAQLGVNYSSAWASATSTGCAVPAEMPAEEPIDAGAPAPDIATTDTASTDPPKPDSEVGVEVTCAEPQPPANVPTADEAEALAADVLDAVGLDPSSFEFETYADDWAASVTAWARLDGVRSPVAWGFGFGGDGVLQWMNGTLASPVATGPYPLIDLDAALQRLTEQNTWFGGRGGVLMDDLAASPGADVPSESPVEGSAVAPVSAPTKLPSLPPAIPTDTVPVDAAPSGTIPADTPSVDTGTVDTVPIGTIPVDALPVDEAPQVATLVDVRADLWWAYDEDGSVWLLPAYTFTDTEGRLFTVPSVTDEFLIVTEPVLIDPMPLEPAPVESVPAPDQASEPDTSAVVGLAVDDATARLAENGLTLRVVIENGTALAVTEDFSTSRVNVEVADGIVVAVVSIG